MFFFGGGGLIQKIVAYVFFKSILFFSKYTINSAVFFKLIKFKIRCVEEEIKKKKKLIYIIF